LRHRETVEGGSGGAGRTVGAMDGAIEPPWMGLRRVLTTHTVPPSHGMPLLLLLLRLPASGRHYQALPKTPYRTCSCLRTIAIAISSDCS
ncbi:hypothetical protein C9414_19375, partial [Bacillus sp. Nf3]